MENLDISNINDIITFIDDPKNNKYNINGNNIIHLLVTRTGENNKIIIKLLKKYPQLFHESNNDGDTPFFMLIRHGKFNLASQCLEIEPSLAKHISGNNESILFYCVDDFDFFKYCITKYGEHIDLNIVASDGIDLMILLIDKNNKYDTLMEFVVKNKQISDKIDFNKKTTNAPIITYSIVSKNLFIFDLLMNIKDVDVNIFDKHNKVPLFYAVMTNNSHVVKKLTTHSNIDINYSCLTDSCNPLHLAITNNFIKVATILVEAKIDLNKTNNLLNNSGHIVIEKYNVSDKNDKIKKLTQMILKKCDLYHKNTNGDTVVDLIKKYKLDKFTKFIDKNKNKSKNNKKKLIIPKYVKPKSQNFGLFNSNMLHSLIYNICMINKYGNIFMPSQYHISDKHNTDTHKLFTYHNFFNDDTLISEYVLAIHDFIYQLVPYILLWNGSDSYMFPKNAKIYYDCLINCKKIRFITTKLTLITKNNVSHANILIYDKHTNTLERFEPYGYYTILDNDDLDDKLYDYFKNIYGKIKYVKPKDYLMTIKFQALSNDNDVEVQKFNDPHGYCLAWTIWYLELRLLNPETSASDLVQKAYDDIIKKYGNQKNTLIDFIRDYSKTLDDAKNDFLTKIIKIPKNDLYNVSLATNDNVISNIMIELNKIKNNLYS